MVWNWSNDDVLSVRGLDGEFGRANHLLVVRKTRFWFPDPIPSAFISITNRNFRVFLQLNQVDLTARKNCERVSCGYFQGKELSEEVRVLGRGSN